MKTSSIRNFTVLILSILALLSFGQEKKMQSPRDSVSGQIGKAHLSINYGSPAVKGRKIWGELVPYNQVWRAGANEATVFTTDKALMIDGKTLPAGKYSFFVLPKENEWTIIFNKTANQWGSYEYKDKDDALRLTVKPKKTGALQEHLIYKINMTSVSLIWENMEAVVPIESK